MDSAEKSLSAYDQLYSNMPSIGILSRKKRAIAYLKVTKQAQAMIDESDISFDNALYLISVLTRKSPDFRKASMAAALNLSEINRTLISNVGFQYANNMRCNMQLKPIDDME